jgi:hypothetical protein
MTHQASRPVVARVRRGPIADDAPTLVALCDSALVFAWPTKLCSYFIAPRGRVCPAATMETPSRFAVFESLAVAPSGKVLAVLIADGSELSRTGSTVKDGCPPSVLLLSVCSLTILARVELGFLPSINVAKQPMVFSDDHTLYLPTTVYKFCTNYDHVSCFAALPQVPPSPYRTASSTSATHQVPAPLSSYGTRMLLDTCEAAVSGIVVHEAHGCAVYSNSFPHATPQLLLHYFESDFRILAVVGLQTITESSQFPCDWFALALVQSNPLNDVPETAANVKPAGRTRPLHSFHRAMSDAGTQAHPLLQWAFIGNGVCTPYSIVGGLDELLQLCDFPLACAATKGQTVVVSTQGGKLILLDPASEPAVVSIFTPNQPPPSPSRYDADPRYEPVRLAVSCSATCSGPIAAVALPDRSTSSWFHESDDDNRMDSVTLFCVHDLLPADGGVTGIPSKESPQATTQDQITKSSDSPFLSAEKRLRTSRVTSHSLEDRLFS